MKLPVKLWLCFKNPYLSGLKGSIDGVYSGSLRGWAHGDNGKSVALIIRKNGVYIGECRADAPRADLAALGLGNGRYGFSLPVPREFAVRLGDMIEVSDVAVPAHKMALKMTRRVVARPGWKGPFAKSADGQRSSETQLSILSNELHRDRGLVPTRRKAYAFTSDPAAAPATEFEGLAMRYEKLAVENQQLRAAVSNYETEIQLNLLQLRQVQEELESWFLKYQDLQARQDLSQRLEDSHEHPSAAPAPANGRGRQ